jgi:hypothetical protein
MYSRKSGSLRCLYLTCYSMNAIYYMSWTIDGPKGHLAVDRDRSITTIILRNRLLIHLIQTGLPCIQIEVESLASMSHKVFIVQEETSLNCYK